MNRIFKLIADFKSGLEKLPHTVAALFDGAAWFLLLPAAFVLWLLDAPMVKTLATWSLYFVVLSAVVIVILRIAFPQIKLTLFVERAFRGSVSNSIVVLGVLMAFALMVMSFVLWARPIGT